MFACGFYCKDCAANDCIKIKFCRYCRNKLYAAGSLK